MSKRLVSVGQISATHGCMEYEWKIPNFFSEQKKYQIWQSREFEFLGAKWQLVLRNGPPLELSIYKTEHGSFDLRVYYTIGIKSFDGTLYKSTHGVKEVQNTDIPYRPRGFLRLSDVLSDKATIVAQDTLTVFCNISIKQEYCERTTSHSTAQTEFSPDIHNLRQNLKDLFTSGEASDVLIKVEDREFRAHRSILIARSTVFATMFRHDTKERGCGTVTVTDCDPEAFEQSLLYLYTGKVDRMSPANVHHLYKIGHKYDIQDLKIECVECMKKWLTTHSFCDVISLALQYKDSGLLENATQFFIKNALEIIKTVKWLSFLKENPVEANELTIKTFNVLHWE